MSATVRAALLGAVFVIARALSCQAESFATEDDLEVGGACFYLNSYIANHHGLLPESWTQLDPGGYLIKTRPNLPRKYEFVPGAPRFELLQNGARLILLGKSPTTALHEDGVGRFVIYQADGEECYVMWYHEDLLQRILKSRRSAGEKPGTEK